MKTCCSTAVALILMLPAIAQAQGTDPTRLGTAEPRSAGADRTRVTVVAGAAMVPSYEGSDDERLIPVVSVFGEIDGYALSTRGTQLQIDLIRNRPGPGWDLQLGPSSA